MKKWILLSLVFLAACSNEITINTDSFNLKGKVKSITDTQSQGIYDKNWNVYPDTAVSVSFISIRNFDEEGKWVDAKMELTNGTVYSTTEVLYDEDGNYAGTKDLDGKGSLFRETTVTEISSKKIAMLTKDGAGKEVSENVSEYVDGLVSKQTTTWSDGTLKISYEYKRDSEGNEEEISIHTVNTNTTPPKTDNVLKVKILKTDVYGNWTRQAYYSSGDNTCTIIDRKIDYYE
ncbi:MAG: hypothetical protein A2W93_07635 [Bacteroidetes bacterium GWF2_43_63]|nr:MAG: hypothetical protein A2W94_02750 [Bacteroidetes bacterium GWE2_42_42]OFY52789.1 MAG: hypothetical protein A2W93_07635 [Bacteroidetes bacterium GWF2_43_63]HBG70007.1 hypothetical protein [Bacteroidales bacterium]HCB62388.1 hypothetical protein [Bacteroidales bacterium]HCY22425.1 hypothetical protein [Bacteroidales bacterium]